MSELDNEIAESDTDYLEQERQRSLDAVRQFTMERYGIDLTKPAIAPETLEAKPVTTEKDPLKSGEAVIGEVPKQVVGGIRDAIAETLNAPTDIVNLFREAEIKGVGDLIPEIEKPDSMALNVVRSAAQFITGFAPIFGGLGKVKTIGQLLKKSPKLGRIVQTEVAGAGAGALVFDPDDPNLSNLINDLTPDLKIPVTEFLATDPDDEEALNRFRNLVEGMGLGALTEGFFHSFRMIRSARGLSKLEGELKGDIEKKVLAQEKEQKPRIEALEEVPPDIESLGITGEETLDELLAKITDTNKLRSDRFKAKRGIRPNITTTRAAQILGLTKEQIKEMPKGTALNAEQLVDVARVVIENLQEMDKLSTKILNGTATSSEKTLFSSLKKDNEFLDPKFFGFGGEVGRSLQIQRKLKPLRERLEAITEGMGRSGISGTTVEEQALLFKTLLKETEPEKVAKWLRISRRTPRMAMQVWLSMLLSGPKTHIVNFMGNTSTVFMGTLERSVAAKLPNSPIVRGEATHMMYGMAMAFTDAVRLAGRTLKTGIAADKVLDATTKLEGLSGKKITAEAFELDKSGLAGKAVNRVGAFLTFPLNALLASDVFFKVINRRAELYALAFREAFNRNLTGKEAGKFMADFILDPPSGAAKQAGDFASYQTFTNDLGTFAQAVQNFANAHMAIKFFLPFVRTPINIFKYSYERTPIGAAHMSIKQTLKGTNLVERDLAIARLGLASMATSAFAMMAGAGMITGSGPANKELRKIMRENGWQPNSILVNGTYVSYQRADPIGMMIGQVADFVEASQYLDYETAEGVALGIVVAFSRNMLSKTYVTGMQNAMDLVSVGLGTGEMGKQFAEARAAGRRVAISFIPTISRDFAKAMDQILREADTYEKAWKSNIPYFSKDVFAERNIFGDPVLRGTNWTSVINPLYITHDKNDKEMEELIKHEAVLSQFPDWITGTKPSFAFEVPQPGEGIKLTDEMQDFWKIETGRGLRQSIRKQMNDPLYKKASNFEKQRRLIIILQSHRQRGKKAMIDKFGLEDEVRGKIKELENFRRGILEVIER